MYERAGLWITRPDETARRADPGTTSPGWTAGASASGCYGSALPARNLTSLIDAEWRRGYLPPRGLGQMAIQEITNQVEQLVQTAQPFLTDQPATVRGTGRAGRSCG